MQAPEPNQNNQIDQQPINPSSIQNFNQNPRNATTITNIRKGSADNQKQTKDQDLKSVFVQSVDYGTTMQQLQCIFQDCGNVVRVTILKQKATGKPKGCAYIQFAQVESVYHAIMLSGTILRKRAIKVSQKRTNIRGMSANRGKGNQFLFSKILTNFGHRGRGF